MKSKVMVSFSPQSVLACKRFFRGCAFLLLIISASCKKDNTFLDTNIIPEDKRSKVMCYDSMEIELSTIISNPLQTSNPFDNLSDFNTYLGDNSIGSYSMLGSMVDPLFGTAKASFLMQFVQVSFEDTFKSNYIFDSLILSLGIDTCYGKSKAVHTFHVYQLNQHIPAKNIYTSEFDPSGFYNPVDLAGNYTQEIQSSVKEIRIPLSNSLGEYLSRVDSATLSTTSNFLNYFHGLYVTTDQVSSGGNIAVNRFSADTLFIHYHYIEHPNDSTERKKYGVMPFYFYYYAKETAISGSTSRSLTCVNMYKHDYLASGVAAYLNPAQKDSVAFMNGMNGVCVKVSIPKLEYLREKIKKPYSIHYAEMVFKNDEGLMSKNYPVTDKIVISALGEDNKYYLMLDKKSNGAMYTTYSGRYDATRTEYHISLTYFINEYLEARQNYKEFVVFPYHSIFKKGTEISSGLFMPSGAVLKKPVLKIYYNTF